jgi:hypothetical protein
MLILLTKFQAVVLTGKAAAEIAKRFKKSKRVMSILHSIPRSKIIPEGDLVEYKYDTGTSFLPSG